jgi:GH24 family phage-related lysozyme (muramidase)
MDDVIETYPHIKDRHRQWAVAMFAFNMKGGVQALKGTNLERHILNSDWDAAADQLLKWNKAYNPKTQKYRPLRGLTKKRKFEAYLLRGTQESIEKAFAKKEYYQVRVISKIAKAKNT